MPPRLLPGWPGRLPKAGGTRGDTARPRVSGKGQRRPAAGARTGRLSPTSRSEAEIGRAVCRAWTRHLDAPRSSSDRDGGRTCAPQRPPWRVRLLAGPGSGPRPTTRNPSVLCEMFHVEHPRPSVWSPMTLVDHPLLVVGCDRSPSRQGSAALGSWVLKPTPDRRSRSSPQSPLSGPRSVWDGARTTRDEVRTPGTHRGRPPSRFRRSDGRNRPPRPMRPIATCHDHCPEGDRQAVPRRRSGR